MRKSDKKVSSKYLVLGNNIYSYDGAHIFVNEF